MYVNTDGLVFPSLNETSSSAPLEAMSLRRPVIATDAEFMRRMTAGKAFYVDFGHPLDTANAVDRATSGELSSRRMIEDAYDWVSSRGTVRQQALEYLQFVRHVMGA
jgi:glycosyltransferase involved in cell wall biosynthesis